VPTRASLITPSSWQRQDRGGFIVHADPAREAPLAFALSVATGLDEEPRTLDASYLYDAAGSALFERITEQPEYYQTRTEDGLLAQHARAIRSAVGDVTLVELGAGSASKTRRLLDPWTAAAPSRYVPIDVSAEALVAACAALKESYPALQVDAVASSFERAFPLLRQASPMALAFLGSSLGNLGRYEQDEFIGLLADHLSPGDFLLVGLDFAKDARVLEAAYDDAAGVTASFTRNLFARMNRELGTEVPLDGVRHVAVYNERLERIEIYAEMTQEVHLHIRDLDRTFRLARGERIRTELSYKYRPRAATAAIARHGFLPVWRAADEERGFGLFLFRRLAPRPAIRGARRLGWESVLGEMRARTHDIVAPLSDEDLSRQHSRLMSPLVWDLGHMAHFESLWLLRKLGPELGADAVGWSRDAAFDPIYDPIGVPRAERDRLPLPTPPATRRYMEEVRRDVRRQLERLERSNSTARLAANGYVVNLVAQHEAQHQETMLQAIALREDLPYAPVFVESGALPHAPRPPERSVLVPAGPFMMGTDERYGVYDNERPAHAVDVPAFRIDVTPVTSGDYLSFMDDGGYRRRELWTDAGWRWRQANAAVAPAHWRPEGSGWRAAVFGLFSAVDPDSPVIHVSWFEADAFARWIGKRLPTEAEWEKAAAWDAGRQVSRRYPWGDAPPDAERANLDQRRLAPAPAGTYPGGRSPYGCLQMLGDVWEWTDTWFNGYPGFESYPYREYSEVFFGEKYRVLRGASFATRAIVARNTFRNWDFPERRQIFAGFRCAQSA
jgi:iron(II)-dependent oxidoreductase